MAENKPVRLSLISAYGQQRMAENKPVRLSLISAYGLGKWLRPKSYDYSWFLHMDKEEWLSPNHRKGLFSAILPCPYVEIRNNRTILVSTIFLVHMQKSGIIVHICSQPFFVDMDNKEWLRTNLYDYPWFLHMD
jgi:hypothetical protein